MMHNIYRHIYPAFNAIEFSTFANMLLKLSEEIWKAISKYSYITYLPEKENENYVFIGIQR